MTIRRKLLAILFTISVLLIGITVWKAMGVIGDLQAVQRSEAINGVAGRLIDSAKYLAAERGQTNGLLSAATPAGSDARNAIAAARQKADAHMQAAIQTLRGLPHDPAVGSRLAETEKEVAALAELRRRVDSEMERPLAQRDGETVGRAFGAFTKLIETSQQLRRAFEEDADSAVLDLKQLQALTHATWAAAEYLGRERGYVNGLIASSRPMGQEQLTFLTGLHGRVDLLWPEIELLVTAVPAGTGLGKTLADLRMINERFDATRKAVIAAGARGEAYGISASQWFSEATILVDALLAMSTQAETHAETFAQALSRGAYTALVLTIVIAILALALIVVAVVVTGRQILAPIAGMTNCMRTLAGGDFSIAVPGIGRSDEIGEMATAVQVFKENGAENEALRRRVEEERQQRERERAEQEATLDRSVGEVVAAAVDGNLTRRIDTGGLNGVMKKLGDEINTLLGTIAGAVDEVGQVIASIAQGNLTRRVHGQYRGVFAELRDNVNRAGETLAETVQKITHATETVNSASGEIASGSQDLAQRTESQAASIEQTAASMHEITATVKLNADNAQAANHLAVAARGAAEKGGEVVQEAVQAVSHIEDSARKISDIISLIDEIAFQTNLLALNASVEAARAGEAGKGFAVVAQEVRALAQRSANASKDIKALITESNVQVKSGASLVNQAGQSLADIVGAIKKVSDIVAEIAAASAEQASGLEQINTAVGSMDETTQRNGALVEQTTAAARSLSNQAQELTGLVRQFQLA